MCWSKSSSRYWKRMGSSGSIIRCWSGSNSRSSRSIKRKNSSRYRIRSCSSRILRRNNSRSWSRRRSSSSSSSRCWRRSSSSLSTSSKRYWSRRSKRCISSRAKQCNISLNYGFWKCKSAKYSFLVCKVEKKLDSFLKSGLNFSLSLSLSPLSLTLPLSPLSLLLCLSVCVCVCVCVFQKVPFVKTAHSNFDSDSLTMASETVK